MGRARGLVGLVALMGLLFMLPASAKASAVTIDEIIFQGGGDSSVLNGTADFSVVGNTLTIVLTNTSTGATGGLAATNLLIGIGFNLPGGVTILNNGASNSVAITGGSSAINFTAPISDARWGAGNGALDAINNLTIGGDVNASASTLQAQIDFDLAGTDMVPPPPLANVGGPSFGLLSNNVSDATAGGLAAVKNSVTLTLLLGGTVPGTLIDGINSGHVVLSFGSPTSVPEPSTLTLLLAGTALVGLGYSARNRLFSRAKGKLAAS